MPLVLFEMAFFKALMVTLYATEIGALVTCVLLLVYTSIDKSIGGLRSQCCGS